MPETRATTVLLMLMAIIILLMLAIAGLFLRMNQLQGQVLAALSSGGPAGVPARDVGLPVGTAAPDFTSPDLAGKSVALKDFVGKPVLLAFSATTCPACQKNLSISHMPSQVHQEKEILDDHSWHTTSGHHASTASDVSCLRCAGAREFGGAHANQRRVLPVRYTLLWRVDLRM